MTIKQWLQRAYNKKQLKNSVQLPCKVSCNLHIGKAVEIGMAVMYKKNNCVNIEFLSNSKDVEERASARLKELEAENEKTI